MALLQPQKPSALAQPEFAWEPFGPAVQEAMPMLRLHWQDAAPFQKVAPIDPDFDAYFELERRGGLAVFTARLGGRLTGLHSWLIQTTLHRRSCFTAISDMLLVTPSARAGWLGYKLLKDSEPELKRRGAVLALVTPASHNNIDPLLRRARYVQTGHCFAKVL